MRFTGNVLVWLGLLAFLGLGGFFTFYAIFLLLPLFLVVLFFYGIYVFLRRNMVKTVFIKKEYPVEFEDLKYEPKYDRGKIIDAEYEIISEKKNR